ncbi:MAG: RNA ligase family protein [Gemmatimonadetes bacterium]|nr:RNA ligase family protein [Gemmatimonadota bacterium]
MLSSSLKYPRTPYWPYSPGIGRHDTVHPEPQRFVGCRVVVTEKLDGSNVLIHRGKVYGRSVADEAAHKWMAMVKKHHAWKVNEPDAYLYGEDIYGVHSIEYGAVREEATFHAFALRDSRGDFSSVAALERFTAERSIPVVPVVYRGSFVSLTEMRLFLEGEQAKQSVLGGEREGTVVRIADGFASPEFARNVCKSVRRDHVQTDRHWTRNWRPCKLERKTHHG